MNNSSATHCDNINFSADQIFLPVLYSVVFCIGLPTNCLALYGLYSLVKDDYALPIYVINLLLADLLQIATLPLWIDYYSRQHVWHYGSLACTVAGSIFFINLYANVLFMCCIALERYLTIVHPLWYQWSRRHKLLTVYLMCLAAWTILVLPVVFSFHIGYKDADESFCKESYPSKKEFAAYRLVTIPITFLLPLFFLAFVYQLVRSHLDEAISVPAKEKKGITGLLLLIMLVFLLVFGPYHVVGYVMHFGSYLNQDSCSHEAQVFLYFQMALGLLSINILLDPVMYIFLSQDATTGTPLWAFYLVSQGRSMKWVTAVVNAGRIRLNECPSKLCSSAQSTIVQ